MYLIVDRKYAPETSVYECETKECIEKYLDSVDLDDVKVYEIKREVNVRRSWVIDVEE